MPAPTAASAATQSSPSKSSVPHSATVMATQNAAATRPQLPLSHLNNLLSTLDPITTPPVKFQVITREGQDIIVGRLKIPTPGPAGSHAFILRRYDTGDISLSTMFRAAFPGASDDEEKRESKWVKATYTQALVPSTGRLRLAGTWVPTHIAKEVAPYYKLESIITPLAEAEPDPNTNYRKSSQRTGSATSSPAQPAPSPNGPNKRRREASPRASTTTTPSSIPVPVNRHRSPATRASTSPRKSMITTTNTGLEDQPTEEEAEVPGPNPEEDIAASQALVASLKAAEASKARRPDDDATSKTPESEQVLRKRALRETTPQPPSINPQEPTTETTVARPIATNRRIHLTANQKSAAWGTLAFAVAVGAVQFLPRFF